MAEPAPDSRGHLDTMLADGRISQAEYDTLLAALETSSKPSGPSPVTSMKLPETPRRLTKCWNDRMLGGVCAGLARHLGMDPTLMRVLVLVLGLVSGGAVLVAYLALYFLVPWDEEAGSARLRFPWGFTIMVAGLLGLNVVVGGQMVGQLKEIYDNLGEELPTLQRVQIQIMDLLTQHPLNLAFVVICAAILIWIFKLLRPGGAARALLAIVTLVVMLAPLMLMYLSLFNLPKVVGRG